MERKIQKTTSNPQQGVLALTQPTSSPYILRAFTSAAFKVRVVTIGDALWFVAADVCRALTIGPEQIRRLDDDEHTMLSTQGIPGAKNPEMNVVSEAGLYSLVLGSRKAEAKIFKRWVTHEVLPEIRKTGTYSLAHLSRKDLFRMGLEAEERAEALEVERNALQIEVQAAQPAVEFVDRYVEAKGEKGVREVAKILRVKPKEFVDWLIRARVMFRENRKLMPFQVHLDKGRFEVKTGVACVRGKETDIAFSQARFTPDGIAWIAAKLHKAQAAHKD